MSDRECGCCGAREWEACDPDCDAAESEVSVGDVGRRGLLIEYGRGIEAGRRAERSDIIARLRATIAIANADGDETGLFQDLLYDIEGASDER